MGRVEDRHLLLGDPGRVLEDNVPLRSVVGQKVDRESPGFKSEVQVFHEIARVDAGQLQMITKEHNF